MFHQLIHIWRLVSNNVDLQLSNTLSLFVDSADEFPSQSTSASYFKVSQAGIDVGRVKHIYRHLTLKSFQKPKMTDDWGTDAGWGGATARLVTISKQLMIFNSIYR